MKKAGLLTLLLCFIALILWYLLPTSGETRFAQLMGASFPDGVEVVQTWDDSTFNDTQLLFELQLTARSTDVLKRRFGFSPGGQDFPARHALKKHIANVDAVLENSLLHFVRRNGYDCFLYVSADQQQAHLIVQGY